MPARYIPPVLKGAGPIASLGHRPCIRLMRIAPARFNLVSSSVSRTLKNMPALTKDLTARRTPSESRSARFLGCYSKSLLLLLLAGAITLSSCGGAGNSYSNNSPQNLVTLAGNWQFTMAPPADGSYLGGLQGGVSAARRAWP